MKPAKAWDGEDRHNGEIASFHLNRILQFNRAPLVTGRKINLTEEILPVATERLKKTFETYQNNTCFYGECHYCKPSYRACAKVCFLIFYPNRLDILGRYNGNEYDPLDG